MNPLHDVLPPKIRKIAYAILFVLALIFAAWQASDGDWPEFAGALVTALFGAMAAANTPAPEYEDTTTVYVPEHRG